MSSRQRKRRLAAQRRAASLDSSVSLTDAPNPHAIAASRTHLRKAQAARDHDRAQVAARALRHDHPQALDWWDNAGKEPQWEWLDLHEHDQTDALGAPLLKEEFAEHLDLEWGRAAGERYHRALTHLWTDRPLQAAALRGVLGSDRTDAPTWPQAERAAAAVLGVSAWAVRVRTWKAARVLEADCVGDVPPPLAEYIAYRRSLLGRRSLERRAVLLAFVPPGGGAPLQVEP